MSTATKARTAAGQVLNYQMGLNRFTVQVNLQGLTHDDSLVQPTPGGNCLNWVLGHVVASRNAALGLLRKEAVWDEKWTQRYGRGAAPVTDARDAAPFDEIVAAFHEAQDRLTEGLNDITEERLAESAPFSPTNNPNETVGSLLAAIVFHEAYHLGQIGVLRRLIGKPGAVR
jgi:uncharacterized damage-inducible protein DinB